MAREINKKPTAEIELTSREIKEFCDAYVRLSGELITACIELDGKTSEKMDKITEVLKEFRKKSAGAEEAYRLNEQRFKEGLERDTFERKIRDLTQEMTSIKFDFDRCKMEIEVFERHLLSLIKEAGIKTSHFPIIIQNIERTRDSKAQNLVSHTVIETYKPVTESKKETTRDFDNYIQAGLAFTKNKQPEKAKECFKNALKLEPHNTNALYFLGRAESAIGSHVDAIKHYKQVLEINPEHTGALCELGFSHGQTGNNKDAGKCYKKLLDLNPGDAKAWTGWGVAEYSSGHFREARKYLEKALEINREYGLAWYNLGLVYASLGNEWESNRCKEEAKKLGF
jgi:tetratricopeptide (TPR) repeat protein